MALTSEDKVEITELAARYNRAIDSGDAEGWAMTFTEDGVFESSQGKAQGREALVRYVEDGAKQRATSQRRHWNNNFVIEGDGDSATLTCYLLLMSGNEVAGRGSYDDVLRRVDGAWRFAHRTVTIER